MGATCIYCDRQSCIKLSENLVFHDKSKHIEMKYQYILNMVEKGVVKLQYIATDEQVTDVLTKPLSKVKFWVLQGQAWCGPSQEGVMMDRLDSGGSEHSRV